MSSNWALYGYIFVGILAFLIFMTYIYPRWFERPKGGRTNHPLHRPKPIILDKDIPGGQAEIQARKNYDNGMVTLHLMNRNGAFVKDYNSDEILPLDITQVLADEEAPMFITRSTRYSETQYAKDINSLTDIKNNAIKDRDFWKKEHANLKANIDVQVEQRVKQAMELQKSQRPDWQGQQGR